MPRMHQHRALDADEMMLLGFVYQHEAGKPSHEQGITLADIKSAIKGAHGYSYEISRCEASLRDFGYIGIPTNPDTGRPKGLKLYVTPEGGDYVTNPANWAACMKRAEQRLSNEQDADARAQLEAAMELAYVYACEIIEQDTLPQAPSKQAKANQQKAARKEGEHVKQQPTAQQG